MLTGISVLQQPNNSVNIFLRDFLPLYKTCNEQRKRTVVGGIYKLSSSAGKILIPRNHYSDNSIIPTLEKTFFT